MKIKQRISNMSIKKKIVFYSYIVITPILIIISTLLFFSNYSDMKKSQDESGRKRVHNLASSLEELNKNIRELSTYICINNDIINILRTTDVKELNENSQLWQQKAPMNFVQDTLAIRGYIKTLSIYPENGVNPYFRCLGTSSYVSSINKIRETQAYQNAIISRGKVNWTKERKGSWELYSTNREDKIVLYREIYDLSKRTPLGYLTIGADAGKYQEICETALGYQDESIIVLNAQGDELLSCGEISNKTYTYLQSGKFKERYLQYGDKNFSHSDRSVYMEQLEESGFIVILSIPRSTLTKQLVSVAYAPILLLLGFLVGLFPVLSLVSNRVIKPLEKVEKAMIEFREGDFSQQVEIKTQDEIGEMAACFNQMVRDIKNLIDENYVMELRQKESELTALQAQINPHFLYNTLDSLYWQAQEASNEEIAENILSLSNLFRLVLGEGKGTIEIGLEKNLIEEYLKVQKMRFTKRLNYEIEIDKGIEREVIPKLILQPFVENAIVHGFENTSVLCNLYVGGKRIKNGIEFVIRDTGVGMSEEQIRQIFEVDDSERYKGQRIGRYAIKNVRERLELKYQDRFDLEVKSELGKGTEIFIRILDEIKKG